MPEVIASYQVSAFVVPTNATTADADQVRGNDNTLQSSLNNHDADPGIHFQGSALASRPVAGSAGRKWMSTDDRRIWYDNGSSWLEAGYLAIGAAINNANLTGVVTVGASIHSAVALTMDTPAATNITLSAGGALNLTAVNSGILMSAGGSLRWQFNSLGHLIPATDGVSDIGASGANRVRTIYQNGSTIVVNASGTKVLGVQQTGWTTDPTGTLARTTFISDSVTLPNLAARVAALIIDLRTHGLVGP